MILFNVRVIHFRTFYEFVYMPPVTVNLRVFMCGAGFFAMTICFESQTMAMNEEKTMHEGEKQINILSNFLRYI
jgi:hypothetical protein